MCILTLNFLEAISKEMSMKMRVETQNTELILTLTEAGNVK
jgi:hypothetical protein